MGVLLGIDVENEEQYWGGGGECIEQGEKVKVKVKAKEKKGKKNSVFGR